MKRDYMIAFRESKHLTIERMAKKCNTTVRIIRMLEDDENEVTHPEIVKDIAKAYKLTKKQAEMMLPKNYRPSSPEYDPDKYRRDSEFEMFGIVPTDHNIPVHVARKHTHEVQQCSDLSRLRR